MTDLGTPSEHTVRVAVASENPCKVHAVEQAFAAALGGVRVCIAPKSVASGVSEQPLGEAETVRGACTRLRNLTAAAPPADYYVALEGGVVPTPTCAALAPVVSSTAPPHSGIEYVAIAAHCGDKEELRVSIVPTAAFPLPRELSVRVVERGEELGPVCDSVFGTHGSKRSLGAVGSLTHGQVARDTLYVPSIQMALIPFLHPDLAFDLPTLADVST